ncbi:MAG: oligosaccharide flippase family protein [Planctomycetota bacterium]
MAIKKLTKTKTDLLIGTGGSVLQKLIGYLILMLLTRHIAKDQVGDYFLAVAISLIVQMVCDLGSNRQLIRSVAGRLGTPGSNTESNQLTADQQQAIADDNQREFSAVVSLRLTLSALAFLLINAIMAGVRPDMIEVMLLTSFYTLAIGVFYAFGAYLIAHRRMVARFATELAGQVMMLGVILGVVFLNGGLRELLIGYVFANLITVATAYTLVRKTHGRIGLTLSRRNLTAIAILGLPIFAMDIVQLVQFKLDTIMLGFIPTATGRPPSVEVANYESAYKLFEASRFIARPILQVFLPIAAGLAAAGLWLKLRGKVNSLLGLATLGGLVIAVPVVLFAEHIIPAVYGPDYDDAIPIARILFWCTPILFINFVAMFLANAMRIERPVLRVMLVGLAVNAAVNAVVIPKYGAMGAASATLASETCVAVILTAVVYRHITKQARAERDAQKLS